MPRELALILCTVFVAFLLKLERRRSAGVSPAVWISTAWMLAIASKPLAVWFGMGGDAESGSPLDRMLLICLAVAGMACLARRRYDWPAALGRHPWLIALLAYMFVSTLWSDITGIALRRWLRDSILVIMALVVMSERDPRRALESVLRRSAYVLIPYSLMLIKYYPRLGVDYARWSGLQMWVGVTVHKNTLGRLCLISAMFLVWALYRRWKGGPEAGRRPEVWADISVLLISLFLLKGDEGAYSATSIGTFVVGILTFAGLHLVRRMQLRLPQIALPALVAFVIGFGAWTPFSGGANLATVSGTFGRDQTLTGRTETWARLVPIVERNPLLGAGFGSFWTTERRDQYSMSNGHNGYLDTLLELGIAGLVLYSAWLLSCTRKLQEALTSDHEWASIAISYLLMAVVYNATESALNTLAEQMTAVVALSSLVVGHERIRSSRRSPLGVRLHLQTEPTAGAVASRLGVSKDRRTLHLFDRRRGQRRGRQRTGNGRHVSGGHGR